jgi:hypothetical protein
MMTRPGILSFDPPADQAAVMHLSAVGTSLPFTDVRSMSAVEGNPDI